MDVCYISSSFIQLQAGVCCTVLLSVGQAQSSVLNTSGLETGLLFAAPILVSRGRMTPLVFWWPETKRAQTNAFKEQLNVSLHPFNKYPNLQMRRSRRVNCTSVISVPEPQDLLQVKAILSCLISGVAAGTNCQTKPLSIVSNAHLVSPSKL